MKWEVIGGDFQLFLPPKKGINWIELKHRLRVQFTVVDWKHTGEHIESISTLFGLKNSVVYLRQ